MLGVLFDSHSRVRRKYPAGKNFERGGRFDGDPIEATVEGRYLFGAAMSGAEVSWSVTASPNQPRSPAAAAR